MAYEQNPKLLESAELRIQQLFATTAHVEWEEKHDMSAAKQRGISLIELIMFIVIVSVALAGILLVMNVTTKGSADPVIHKQALAIAESLLEEIELQDVTPALGGVAACPGAASCVSVTNRMTDYHIVTDYNGFAMNGAISSVNGATVLSGYSASASAAVVATTGNWNGMPAASAVMISVTVTPPSGDTITSVGYRTAY